MRAETRARAAEWSCGGERGVNLECVGKGELGELGKGKGNVHRRGGRLDLRGCWRFALQWLRLLNR